MTFISGGARSGKSAVAESIAWGKAQQSAVGPQQSSGLVYLATGKRIDEEMDQRIRHHQHRRGSEWQTIESTHVSNVLEKRPMHTVVLLDCLTTWLDDALFNRNYHFEAVLREVEHWLSVASTRAIELIIVSNDINEDLIIDNDMVHQYVHILQMLHQILVNKATYVLQVVGGLPHVWKADWEGEPLC
ncbi:bifunctional adenosylcobinamide kinase/adenosylcobinamide-phosphate guanylyltransferase [Caldalkalibacillus salinus]|uniref:bifunctional adenosylcobinamide kinase/adenosylcobinamide-phosphate guanylyltransferase n=1 Tax=Caldalkalibacillus salinus TaxID=2803787 RepID=UPI0019234A05